MYTEQDLVAIAKRENNTKRSYLVVNKLQAKHVAVSPSKALNMFWALGDEVKKKYPKEKLLLIGFAETATAIGAAIATELDAYYMQTTRESIENVEYLFFSEEHSHATEQKLIKTDLDTVIGKVDRVIFIEDEVTTGNTILNIIKIMEKVYSEHIKFSVASILNGMNGEAKALYESRGIETIYLVKTNHDAYAEIADKFCGNGDKHVLSNENCGVSYKEVEVSHYLNARRLNQGCDYRKACERLWEAVKTSVAIGTQKRVLVLGTEEFMYPSIFVGEKIEKEQNEVRCHSTTRSPIEVSMEREYPLHTRYELASLYDKNRKTFLYDIGAYDIVLILTDADNQESEGIQTVLQALQMSGNKNINLIRWCNHEELI